VGGIHLSWGTNGIVIVTVALWIAIRVFVRARTRRWRRGRRGFGDSQNYYDGGPQSGGDGGQHGGHHGGGFFGGGGDGGGGGSDGGGGGGGHHG
jgi:hypothetical protein